LKIKIYLPIQSFQYFNFFQWWEKINNLYFTCFIYYSLQLVLIRICHSIVCMSLRLVFIGFLMKFLILCRLLCEIVCMKTFSLILVYSNLVIGCVLMLGITISLMMYFLSSAENSRFSSSVKYAALVTLLLHLSGMKIYHLCAR